MSDATREPQPQQWQCGDRVRDRIGRIGTVVAHVPGRPVYVRPDVQHHDNGLDEVRDPGTLERVEGECCPTCHGALTSAQAVKILGQPDWRLR